MAEWMKIMRMEKVSKEIANNGRNKERKTERESQEKAKASKERTPWNQFNF